MTASDLEDRLEAALRAGDLADARKANKSPLCAAGCGREVPRCSNPGNGWRKYCSRECCRKPRSSEPDAVRKRAYRTRAGAA